MCQAVPAGTSYRLECDTAADQPRCQLCPKSPTYWKLTAAPSRGTKSWDGTRDKEPTVTPLLDLGVVYAWGSGTAARTGKPKPCVQCGHPTTIISPPSPRWPDGRPIHKTCAEAWATAHRDLTS